MFQSNSAKSQADAGCHHSSCCHCLDSDASLKGGRLGPRWREDHWHEHISLGAAVVSLVRKYQGKRAGSLGTCYSASDCNVLQISQSPLPPSPYRYYQPQSTDNRVGLPMSLRCVQSNEPVECREPMPPLRDLPHEAASVAHPDPRHIPHHCQCSSTLNAIPCLDKGGLNWSGEPTRAFLGVSSAAVSSQTLTSSQSSSRRPWRHGDLEDTGKREGVPVNVKDHRSIRNNTGQ